MPNISDRIGNQNVIRVLSNVGGLATRLVDLSDVDVSSLADGFVLEYKAQTSKFITTDSFRFLKNVNVTGILTTYNLDVIGITTFRGDLYVGSDLYVKDFLHYQDNYEPNGIAYFDDVGRLISGFSTETYVENTNYIFTTTQEGTPVWSSVIEGGTY
jgi:hypothetical protein